MKSINLTEKMIKRSENFYLCGLIMSKMTIFLISLPLMMLGMYMAQTMTTSPTFVGVTGVIIVIVSGVIYVTLTMKKLVSWGMEIGELFFKIFNPKLYQLL